MDEYKYRISKLYHGWDEVIAELGGARADHLNKQHRVLTLVDCDVDCCDDPDCEYCGGEPVEIDDDAVEGPDPPYHPSISIMLTGFHYVNRMGYYIIDPPWQDDDEGDNGIPDEMVHFSDLPATKLLGEAA
jgi:hypothetical protein